MREPKLGDIVKDKIDQTMVGVVVGVSGNNIQIATVDDLNSLSLTGLCEWLRCEGFEIIRKRVKESEDK